MLLEFLSSAGGGGLAGAGMSLLGGLFGQNKADKARAADRQMAQAQFNAQMDESIQRRVKDAQAAGVHPLFGLGASVGASPTLSAGGDSSSAGAPVANALGKAGGMLANAAIAKTHAEAQLAAAQAARVRQDMDSQGRDKPAVDTFGIPDTQYRGQVEVMPARIMSPRKNDIGTEAGIGPFKRERVDPDGQVVQLFSEDSQMDEANQYHVASQRAKWHAEWKIWDFNRGTGKRAHQAKKWILNHTAPHKRREVLQRLDKAQRSQKKRLGRYPRGFREWQQYQHRGGTMSWRRFKSIGGY